MHGRQEKYILNFSRKLKKENDFVDFECTVG